MTTPAGGPGSINFSTNINDVLQVVGTGVREMEALLKSAGGSVAKQGVLGQALAKDAQDITRTLQLLKQYEAQAAQISAMPTRGKNQRAARAQAVADFEREFRSFQGEIGLAADRVMRGVETRLLDPKTLPTVGTKKGVPVKSDLSSIAQIRRVGKAEAEAIRERTRELDHAHGEAEEMYQRHLRAQARANGSADIGRGFAFDSVTGAYSRVTQRGRGLDPRALDAVETEQARAQHAAFLRADAAKQLAQQRRTDPFASFTSHLGSGGFGGGGEFSAAGIAGSFGTTLKYTAMYSILGAVQRAFGDTISEAKDYRDSLTDLQVAIGGTIDKQDDMVLGLAKVSKLTGGNVGEALDSAARGIRAFTDPGDTPEVKKAVGLDFARAVGNASIITGKSITDIRGDVIAIAASFGEVKDDFERVNDIAAGSKLLTGADPTQVTQGLANAGEALNEVGFSADEAGALIGAVIAKLDESGQTAATRLARITSIISGGAGRALLASLPGVGVEGTARDQLFRLAQQYPKLNDAQQAAVRNTLGQANVRELIVSLTELQPDGKLFKGFAEGFQNAGKGAAEAQRKTTDLVGQLRKLSGLTRNLQIHIFDSGAFVPFAAALKVMMPALQTLDDIITALNKLFPEWARSAAWAIAEVALGLTILGKFQLNAAKAAVTTAKAMEVEAAAAGQLTLTLEQQAIAAKGVAAANLLAARSANTIAGSALGAGTNAAKSKLGAFFGGVGGKAGAIGAALIVGDIVYNGGTGARSSRQDALDADVKSLTTIGKATTSEKLHEAAESLRTAAQKNDKASSGIFGNLRDDLSKAPGAKYLDSVPYLGPAARFLGVHPGEDNEKQAKRDREAAEILDKRSRDLKELLNKSAASGDAGVFGDVTSIDNLNNGLEALRLNGASATTQLRLLSKALGTAFKEGEGGPGTILPGSGPALGEKTAASFADLLTKSSKELDLNVDDDPVKQAKLHVKIGQTVQDYIDSVGATSGGQLTPEQLTELANKLSLLYVDPKATKKQQEDLQRLLFFGTIRSLRDLTDPSKLITDQTTSAQVQALMVGAAGQSAADVQLVTGDKVLAAQAKIAGIREAAQAALNTGTKPTDETRLALIAAERELDQAESTRADSYEDLAKARLGSNNNLGRLHMDLATAERHYNEALSRGDIEAANAALVEGYNTADAIQKANDDLEDLGVELLAARRKAAVRPGNSLAAARAEVQSAKERERLALDRVKNGRKAPTLDFDTQGNITGAAPDFVAIGDGIGKSTAEGIDKTDFDKVGADSSGAVGDAWTNQDWSGLGERAAQKVQDAFDALDLGPGDGKDKPKDDKTKASAQSAQDDYLNSLDINAHKPGGAATTPDLPTVLKSLHPYATLIPAGNGVPAHYAENLSPVLRSLLNSSGLEHGKVQGFSNRKVHNSDKTSTHALNDALDIFGTPAELKEVVNYFKTNYSKYLAELIYTPTNTFLGKGGKAFKPNATVAADHKDHVHVSITRNSLGLSPVPTVAAGAGGAPTGGAPATDPTQAKQDQINAANATEARRQAEFEARQIELQTIEARARLKVYAGSELGNARIDLNAAYAQLTLYEQNTLEFYNALRNVNEKKIALANLEADLLHDRRLLKIDMTDPVAMADDAAREAKAKYDRDKKLGASEDVLNKDRLDYRNKQNAAEAARFSQRLSDAQTAHDLGRLSDAAYLRYLQSEHDRLSAIKVRTHQQTDELNQIDLAIKAATDSLANGQFNISDIRVPTPYEVRRQVTAGVGTGGYQQFTAPTTSVVVNVNGGDTEAVKGLLARYIGPQAFQRSSIQATKV